MDLNVQGMSGVEATGEILRRCPETRIIGLSVHDGPATARGFLKAGANAFLSKSDRPDRLVAAVR